MGTYKLPVVKANGINLGGMSHLSGASLHVVKTVLNNFRDGKRKKYVHGNSNAVKSINPATMSFISWMKQFASFYGQHSPDTNQIILRCEILCKN